MSTGFSYTVSDPNGIHARPASVLVKKAAEAESEVTVSVDKRQADAKSIFSIMGLGIKQGDVLTVSVTGPDEEKTATELEAFFKENL
ncbi:MAG: HPr family phosphocarrier protein [Bifidobacterium sp.]|uniref:HPr family phosphocarrier protein n=1 Tax=Bifidobacterium sp. TaxID=41200 RepID=UPI0039EC0FDF